MRLAYWPLLILLATGVIARASIMAALPGGVHEHRQAHGHEHAHGHGHSHGHWHGDVYHAHYHVHAEPVSGSLEDHAQQPHDHCIADGPNDESSSTTVMATAARRHQWKPSRALVGMAACVNAVHWGIDISPPTPPPRSRAGPWHHSQIALRTVVLQV